ncbi:glutamine synthetase family protein [Oceanibacterium hippocampi]|uniref:Gamma-glutamylputrescine synthetase PuuA n=1 Tax=Oceanibacterium hippocampi TaxID=745714 RepID=A0A1Y5TXI9_9PROT|nr:glutamine synthetase [Oceanibacterium hippocampi]SLN75898.1 Gamma-glutamylputrescine synthetase PuuA [Oceanibacterium hippocampi]
MTPDQVKTAADARKIVEQRGLQNVKVGLFDADGVMRGKYMSRDKFLSALDGGFGFCDVVLGWDSNDQLYDNVTYTGWHTGYPDAMARILPGTCREIPFENGMLLFLAEFTGRAEEICPRGVLRRVVDKAAAMGFSVKAACEFEFFLFEESPHSVRDKNYQDLRTITPGFFGYSMLRNSVHADFYEDLLSMCREMRMDIEGLHTETGPGVLEAAIAVDEIVEAADRAALFKTYTKILAQRRDWMATFMAKWSPDWPGQSGHIHLSLGNRDGTSAFHDPSAEHNISRTMRHFIGGQLVLMPEILAMIASTVNSYSRLIPGFWAPTSANWGIENRTTALRAIPGGPKSQRVEYRVAAADINPYIALAAALGSGLWGIENEIEPDAPITGNAYDRTYPVRRRFPATLFEAAGRLRKSKAARGLFSDAFVEHFAGSREWEEREFRRAITDWELQRYFEII